MSDISRITLSPNGGTRNIKDNLAIANITRSGTTYTVTRRNGSTFTFDQQDDNTTYTLTQDLTDGHIIIFTDSAGNSTSITIPDIDTNYTIEADTTNNQIKLVPSSGTATAITVPFATNATNAVNATKATQDESGNNIKASYGASLDINDHTISLKNKNGVELSTVTVPDNNTTYTFATGDANGQIKVTPSGGSAQNVSVKGLGTAAYKNVAVSADLICIFLRQNSPSHAHLCPGSLFSEKLDRLLHGRHRCGHQCAEPHHRGVQPDHLIPAMNIPRERLPRQSRGIQG